MKRFFHVIFSALILVLLSGCVQDKIVIHVKPDGSGTIEETSLLSNSMLDMMGSLSDSVEETKPERGETQKVPQGNLKKETRDDFIAKMVADAAKRAENFGTGVKFVSAKPERTDTSSGYVAVYSFENIDNVKVNQNQGELGDGDARTGQASLREENLLFKFTKGSPARLVITLPNQDTGAGDKKGAPDTGRTLKSNDISGKSNKESSVQTSEMMKNIFQDMKLSVSVLIEGTIVATNASYRDGAAILLIDVDFGKIINNGTLFKEILAVNPQSIGETKASFKNVEGLRFETVNPVTVEFR